jgi:hypothetical protein
VLGPVIELASYQSWTMGIVKRKKYYTSKLSNMDVLEEVKLVKIIKQKQFKNYNTAKAEK